MALARPPWVDQVWALPFLTVFAPAERYDQSHGRRPHSQLDQARQTVRLVRRWWPSRAQGVVGDRTDAALDGLDAVRESACVITRWRMDAALYAPAPPRRPKQNGRPCKQGVRLPTLPHRVADPTTPWRLVTVAPWYGQKARRVHIASATAVWHRSGLPPGPIQWVHIHDHDPAGTCAPHALLATKLDHNPRQLLTGFIQRWRLETTIEDARAHLGIETPRQWNEPSVCLMTSAPVGLYSSVTLPAAHLLGGRLAPVRTTAWHPKPQATFFDAMALVRRALWCADHFPISSAPSDVVKIPRSLLEPFDRCPVLCRMIG